MDWIIDADEPVRFLLLLRVWLAQISQPAVAQLDSLYQDSLVIVQKWLSVRVVKAHFLTFRGKVDSHEMKLKLRVHAQHVIAFFILAMAEAEQGRS